MVNNFLNTPPTAGIDYANFTSFTLGFANDFAIINQDIANINQQRSARLGCLVDGCCGKVILI